MPVEVVHSVFFVQYSITLLYCKSVNNKYEKSDPAPQTLKVCPKVRANFGVKGAPAFYYKCQFHLSHTHSN